MSVEPGIILSAPGVELGLALWELAAVVREYDKGPHGDDVLVLFKHAALGPTSTPREPLRMQWRTIQRPPAQPPLPPEAASAAALTLHRAGPVLVLSHHEIKVLRDLLVSMPMPPREAWDCDGNWWRWACECGATMVIVPPDSLLEHDTDDDTVRHEPACSRAVITCPWCGAEDAEDYALEHAGPHQLLKGPG